MYQWLNENCNETRKLYEKLKYLQQSDNTDTDLRRDLAKALPILKKAITCDRCGHHSKEIELSDTGFSYCKRCYRAVTDGKTPY